MFGLMNAHGLPDRPHCLVSRSGIIRPTGLKFFEDSHYGECWTSKGALNWDECYDWPQTEGVEQYDGDSSFVRFMNEVEDLLERRSIKFL